MPFKIPYLFKIFGYFFSVDKPVGRLTRSRFIYLVLKSCTVTVDSIHMNKSWLQKMITTKIAESKFKANAEVLSSGSFLFDLENYNWEYLKTEIDVGDELWTFSTPEDTWKNLCGRGGVCILRDGEIVKSVLIIMS